MFSLLLLTPVIYGCEDREREDLRMFRTKAENLLRENSILEKRNERLKELVKKLRRERNELLSEKGRLEEPLKAKTVSKETETLKASGSSSKLKPIEQRILATDSEHTQTIDSEEPQTTQNSKRSKIKKSQKSKKIRKKQSAYQLISPVN